MDKLIKYIILIFIISCSENINNTSNDISQSITEISLEKLVTSTTTSSTTTSSTTTSTTTTSSTTTSTTTTIPVGLNVVFDEFKGKELNNYGNEWYPPLFNKCSKDFAYNDETRSPNYKRITDNLANGKGRYFQYEPGIIFADETFTAFVRPESENTIGGTIKISESTMLGSVKYDTFNQDQLLYDDGTNGDLYANDGVFTNTCLFLKKFDNSKNSTQLGDMLFINPKYRGSVDTTYITRDIRINEVGFFINTGNWYFDAKFENGNFGPMNCYPCKLLWELGYEFDFNALISREAIGGWGYSRVHDNFSGSCINEGKPQNIFSNDQIMQELKIDSHHQEWIGMVHNDWIHPAGFTHEIMHGLVGLGCTDFPASGEYALNYGDGMHLKSETTINSSLTGSFWDPERGHPYSVRIRNQDGNYREAYLTKNENDQFILRPYSEEEAHIESDFILYQFGLINKDDVTDTYYSLPVSKITLKNCFNREVHEDSEIYGEYQDLGLFCDSNVLNVTNVVSFELSDFITKYGEWRVNDSPNFNPKKIRVAMTFNSDRPHTEAEITWHTLVFKEYQNNKKYLRAGKNTFAEQSYPTWLSATRGLSELIISPNELKK